MVRKRNRPKETGALINVAILPEVHKVIAHQAIDEGRTMREQVNLILCRQLDRMDLWDGIPEPEAVAS